MLFEKDTIFLIRLTKDYWRQYLSSFLLIAFSNFAEIALVRITSNAVEHASLGQADLNVLIILFALTIIVFILKALSRAVTFFTGRRIEKNLRSSIFSNALGLSQSEMDNYRTGDIVSRIINDVSDVRMVLGSGFLQITNNIFAFSLTIMVMLYLLPEFAAAALLPFIPIFIIARSLTHKMHTASGKAQDALGSLSALIEETVAGIELIKSHTAEVWQNQRFQTKNDFHLTKELERTVPESVFFGIMSGIIWIGIIAVLFVEGILQLQRNVTGAVSITDLATFIFLFAKLVWPAVAMGWIVNVIQRGRAASLRLIPFADLNTAEAEECPAYNSESLTAIEFSNVSFMYPARTKNIICCNSFKIEKGEWVGIAGPTAAGKTTLMRLAAGLRVPDEGSVKIFGREVTSIPFKFRKNIIHIVTQNPLLFSMTIQENLLLGKENASLDEIIDAIRDAAFLPDLLQMTKQLDTRIGEKGLLLSGGQRQRLALARALLLEPELLILDDILSAVDVDTEQKILEGINRRRKNLTTVFVTHRLLLLEKVNRVGVISNGSIKFFDSLSEAMNASQWLKQSIEAEQLMKRFRSAGTKNDQQY